MPWEYPKRRNFWFGAAAGEGDWGIPKGRRLRVGIVIGCLFSLPILSALVNGIFSVSFAVSALLCIFFSLVYLVSSCFPHQREILKATDISNFYPRWYVIFEAIVLACVVGFVIYRLWVQFPD